MKTSGKLKAKPKQGTIMFHLENSLSLIDQVKVSGINKNFWNAKFLHAFRSFSKIYRFEHDFEKIGCINNAKSGFHNQKKACCEEWELAYKSNRLSLVSSIHGRQKQGRLHHRWHIASEPSPRDTSRLEIHPSEGSVRPGRRQQVQFDSLIRKTQLVVINKKTSSLKSQSRGSKITDHFRVSGVRGYFCLCSQAKKIKK